MSLAAKQNILESHIAIGFYSWELQKIGMLWWLKIRSVLNVRGVGGPCDCHYLMLKYIRNMHKMSCQSCCCLMYFFWSVCVIVCLNHSVTNIFKSLNIKILSIQISIRTFVRISLLIQMYSDIRSYKFVDTNIFGHSFVSILW